MKIIISPAKKLSSENFVSNMNSEIRFRNESEYLVNILRGYGKGEIKKLMNLSDQLVDLNYSRFQDWSLDSNSVSSAIYMFQGDVYKGLRVNEFSKDDLYFAQDNLRILSGLYGLLRPLDIIFPYRLEMGTRLPNNRGDNLYDFWGNILMDSLLSEMQDDEVLVNLASNEYSKVLNLGRFNRSVITPVFKDYKNGNFKVVSFFAKKARGEMARFIIRNKIKTIDDIMLFNTDGYKFSEAKEGELLFCR